MPSAPSVLDYFMDAYLGVERSSDIDHALRAFAKEEGSERVNLLRRELQNLLGKESSTDKLSAAISKVGRYAIAPDSSPRLFLVKLFERSQLVGASEPYRRPFDAFVSHSHSDAITAKRLVVELERAGFKAWLDDKEILAGHDIVEEVFRGIGASDFLLVLLSKAAVASRWVQRELNAAFLREMERKQVVVIPVLLEQCEVPQQLLTKKHVDLARSWDEGVRLILASLEGHRANRELREISREIPTRNETTKLMSFYQRALTDVGNAEWPPTEAFKDVAIGPLDNEVVQLPKEKLLETIRSFRVSLQNWGGESFPYDEMSSAEISNFSNGVRLIDRNAWPYSDWSFFYWRFEEDCFFAQRSYLYEDHSNNLRTPERLLSAEWVAKDVLHTSYVRT